MIGLICRVNNSPSSIAKIALYCFACFLFLIVAQARTQWMTIAQSLGIDSTYLCFDCSCIYCFCERINQIAFGPQAHGIEQAARAFFGKTASEINLAEAAMLAGLPKSPTRYNPYRHMERAQKRQRVVLSRMVATGYITRRQAEEAIHTPITLASTSRKARTGSYFLDMVIRHLEDHYGTDVVHHGGLKVSTTIDPQLQTWAEEAIEEGLENQAATTGTGPENTMAEAQHPQGALVANRKYIEHAAR